MLLIMSDDDVTPDRFRSPTETENFSNLLHLTEVDQRDNGQTPLSFHKEVPKNRRDFYNRAYDESVTLALAALTGLRNNDRTAFHRYFRDSDADFVKAVFTAFVNAVHDPSGESKIKYMVIRVGDSSPIQRRCISKEPPVIYVASRGGDTDGYWSGSSIHACKEFWTKPFLDAVDCNYVKKNWQRVNRKMATAGSYFLHEWMHYSEITKAPNDNKQIDDQTITNIDNKATRWCYGPFFTHQYCLSSTPTPRLNADNFAWFATEQYWSAKCSQKFDEPVEKESEDQTDQGAPATLGQRRKSK